jgi:hypothetical protein
MEASLARCEMKDGDAVVEALCPPSVAAGRVLRKTTGGFQIALALRQVNFQLYLLPAMGHARRMEHLAGNTVHALGILVPTAAKLGLLSYTGPDIMPAVSPHSVYKNTSSCLDQKSRQLLFSLFQLGGALKIMPTEWMAKTPAAHRVFRCGVQLE